MGEGRWGKGDGGRTWGVRGDGEEAINHLNTHTHP